LLKALNILILSWLALEEIFLVVLLLISVRKTTLHVIKNTKYVLEQSQ